MKKDISIIVPLFNEEQNVNIFADQLRKVLDSSQDNFEVIFVDDGSTDRTFDRIKDEFRKDNRFQGIRFRKNCGQTAAIKAGIEHANGEICITMDGDLQHDPGQIPEFIDKMREGYDLVCSYRFQRDDAFIRRFPSKVANSIARRFSGLGIHDFGSTYRAYRTELAKEIPIYGEMHRFIPVFMAMQTSHITELPIKVQPRIHGTSSYGFGRTFRVFSDLVLLLFFSGFFNRPIHIFGYISVLTGLPGFLILGWLGIGKLFGSLAIMDYQPLFFLGVLLCLFAGQMFTTGIVCEYLIRIYYGSDSNSQKPFSIMESTFDEGSQ